MHTILEGMLILLVLWLHKVGGAQIIFGPLKSDKPVVIGKPLNISCSVQNINDNGDIYGNDSVKEIDLIKRDHSRFREFGMSHWDIAGAQKKSFDNKWTYEYTGSAEGSVVWGNVDTVKLTASKPAAEWADIGFEYLCTITYLDHRNPHRYRKLYKQSQDLVFVECKDPVDCGPHGACGKDNMCGCQPGNNNTGVVQTIITHRENPKCSDLCTSDCPRQCATIDVQIRYEGNICRGDDKKGTTPRNYNISSSAQNDELGRLMEEEEEEDTVDNFA